jgi:hypothetical protein
MPYSYIEGAANCNKSFLSKFRGRDVRTKGIKYSDEELDQFAETIASLANVILAYRDRDKRCTWEEGGNRDAECHLVGYVLASIARALLEMESPDE